MTIGVSDLAGPTEARAGTPATYTYTSRFPAGATPVVTPTCETGTVTGSSSSSFTCSFPDVVSSTASHAKLHAVVPINPSQSLTFDRTLDISILPRLTTVSPLSGPTTVTERATATYTYSETYAPGGIVSDVIKLADVTEIASAEAVRIFPAYLDAVERLVKLVDGWNAR